MAVAQFGELVIFQLESWYVQSPWPDPNMAAIKTGVWVCPRSEFYFYNKFFYPLLYQLFILFVALQMFTFWI